MTSNNQPNILIVDDEPLVRELISRYLNNSGYTTVEANDGLEALSVLRESSELFEAVILDRNMPNMNGLEMLAELKKDPDFNKIPVIMQTASGQKHEILEGLEAGCYYYLTKPFEKELMLSVVKFATEEYLNYKHLQESLKKQNQSLGLLNKGNFSYKTLDEAKLLTTLLASACPEPDKVAMGLSELLINAVEHGNLGISYSEKSNLLSEQRWEEEIKLRLKKEQYSSLFVSVQFERNDESITIFVEDQGTGFDWQDYLTISPDRTLDAHGRGIAMANMLSFNNIEYQGEGNKVLATLNLS